MPAYNQLGYQIPYVSNYYTNPYSNYNPYSYAANMVPQQNQNLMNQMPPQNQFQTNGTSGIIWISNEQEAQMYPVAPNNAVTLWHSSEPVVYLKQADATGKPTLKVFDLVERKDTVSSEGSENSHQYATKEELSATLQAMNDLTSAMGSLRNDINAMKDDMYGLAGKKKTVRKAETDSDE